MMKDPLNHLAAQMVFDYGPGLNISLLDVMVKIEERYEKKVKESELFSDACELEWVRALPYDKQREPRERGEIVGCGI